MLEAGNSLNLTDRWESCGEEAAKDAYFGVIGRDETGIPIVATRIGDDGPNKKKLVIAGPHGDERNAQRLIMTAQKRFIDEGPSADTVLYFIPCLSPTMCFADARGIPNEFWEGGVERNPMKNGPFRLKLGLTIPRLHDVMNQTMRNNIQGQQNPLEPIFGVDANRDFYFSLLSSQRFRDFIKTIKESVNVTDDNMDITETEIFYRNVKIDTVRQKTIKNIRVFMIHGYDSTGAVYGPYSVSSKGILGGKIAANMCEEDRKRVRDIMTKRLDMPLFTNYDDTDPYLYLDTETNAGKYRGEWSQHLYSMLIWAADIELRDDKPLSYNEGVRYFGDEKEPEKRPYNVNLIGSTDLPYFKDDNTNKFYKFLGDDFPWQPLSEG
jgi:hypothetical protein